MTRVTPVARGGLLLHVGPHKTGTTTVQEAFVTHRESLVAHGVAYPGKSAAPHGAVIARLGTPHGWYDELEPTSIRRWERLCQATRATDATVVVSSEGLCHADDEQAAAVCGELRPGPVRVVITLRPLTQLLPSSWQEYLKAGWTETYDAFLEEVLHDVPAGRDPTRRVFDTFWRRQDHGRLVERWSAAVGPENVTVVVADPARPSMLLDTFDELAGLPHGFLSSGGAGHVANRSLSIAECELLRQLNVAARRALDWDTYNSVFRSAAFTALADRPLDSGASRLGLTSWAESVALQRGRAASEQIRHSGVEVVGDLTALGELAPQHTGASWSMPDVHDVSADAFVAAAMAVVHAVDERQVTPTRRRHRSN